MYAGCYVGEEADISHAKHAVLPHMDVDDVYEISISKDQNYPSSSVIQ
jgi:hypothetical protein